MIDLVTIGADVPLLQFVKGSETPWMATNELIEPTDDANERTGGDAKTNTSCRARGVTCSLTRSQHCVIYGPSEGVAVLDAPESILPHVIDMPSVYFAAESTQTLHGCVRKQF